VDKRHEFNDSHNVIAHWAVRWKKI